MASVCHKLYQNQIFRWYKRDASSESKVEIQGNGHELILKSVKRPSGGQSYDGLYSCEIGIFSKIILKSPEELLRVVCEFLKC